MFQSEENVSKQVVRIWRHFRWHRQGKPDLLDSGNWLHNGRASYRQRRDTRSILQHCVPRISHELFLSFVLSRQDFLHWAKKIFSSGDCAYFFFTFQQGYGRADQMIRQKV